MRATLVASGYEIDEAKNGEVALERIREFRPDLVVLDVNMPGMGGLAACRAIRSDTNIAISMLTVRNSEEDKVAALDAGADDLVTKPFSTPELLARIRAALRRVQSPQSSPDKIRDYLRVFIKNLRKKLERNPENPEYITTEPWVGYLDSSRAKTKG